MSSGWSTRAECRRQPSGIEAGDFNSDGLPDMVVSSQLSNNIGLILSNP
ncbi:MAG: FG-GAP repeat protein [Myxococcota bacterium]